MKKLTWLVLLLGIQGASLGSSRAWAQSGITQQNGRQVTCASDDGKRHLCRVHTSRGVQMTNQRSGSPSIQGQTWGYDRRGIWVDRGCRADFYLGSGRPGGGPGPPPSPGPIVTCSSNDGRRNYCPANTSRGVLLVNQRSGSPCIQGQTWGYDNRGIWVDRGWPGRFPSGEWRTGRSPGGQPPSGITITCSSNDGKRNWCPANTSRGVRLTNQRSGSPCIQGQTLGLRITGEVSGLTAAAEQTFSPCGDKGIFASGTRRFSSANMLEVNMLSTLQGQRSRFERCPETLDFHPALAAGLARVGVGAFGLGSSFGHIRAGLGCPVVLRSRAVIDLGGCIKPNKTWSATGSRRGRSRSRCLGLHGHRGRSGSRSSGGRSSTLGGSGSWSRSRSGRIPGLYPFMASARTALGCTRPIGTVITEPGGPSGCACRGLGRTYLGSDHCGYSQRGCGQHRTDQYLHVHSS